VVEVPFNFYFYETVDFSWAVSSTPHDTSGEAPWITAVGMFQESKQILNSVTAVKSDEWNCFCVCNSQRKAEELLCLKCKATKEEVAEYN
jgi:hypothetical protein